MPRLRRLTALLALVALGALAVASTSAPANHAGSTPKITGAGVGKVKLGKTYRQLRKQKLVGRIRRGCELGGPKTRAAALRRPLRGSVDFTTNSRRKVRNITVTGGAKARGVGKGATLEDIRAAFRSAKVDRNTEDVFGLTRVIIPRADGGRFEFGIDTQTRKVVVIGVPGLAFCE